MNTEKYQNYLRILEEELIPAMGCTEPIAIAYAAAKARQVLGKMPERMVARDLSRIFFTIRKISACKG